MSNAMKLFVRSGIILVLFVIGSWLNIQFDQPGFFMTSSFIPPLVTYIVYFLIGITVGSMVSPRFSKNRSKGVHLIPVIIFAIIGAQWFYSSLFSFSSLPWGIGDNLLQYAVISWTIVGVFTSQLFR